MCLPIDCWLCCMPRTVDDDPAPASRTRSHYNGAGGHHYNGNGYATNSRVAAEADRKASNDARRDHAHVVAAGAATAHRGWHNGHATATAAQEKAAVAAYPYPYAGANGTLKQQQPAAAWNGKVATADGHHGARGGAPHNYYEHAQPPAHREDAADSYFTAANHERY